MDLRLHGSCRAPTRHLCLVPPGARGRHRRTRFTYATNASGRPFLQTLLFGGRGEDFQYRVELAYTPLAQPFVDYRSGQALWLDQRVSQVKVLAKHAPAGTWHERWRYVLSSQQDDSGSGFFLAKVQQVYASGEQPPPTQYTYPSASTALQVARFQPLPEMEGLLATYGEELIQPWKRDQGMVAGRAIGEDQPSLAGPLTAGGLPTVTDGE